MVHAGDEGVDHVGFGAVGDAHASALPREPRADAPRVAGADDRGVTHKRLRPEQERSDAASHRRSALVHLRPVQHDVGAIVREDAAAIDIGMASLKAGGVGRESRAVDGGDATATRLGELAVRPAVDRDPVRHERVPERLAVDDAAAVERELRAAPVDQRAAARRVDRPAVAEADLCEVHLR